MSDIIERLRSRIIFASDGLEAADEIERLRAENARLRGLLADTQYIQTKADYNRGHLSHYGWLQAREQRPPGPASPDDLTDPFQQQKS